MADAERVAEIGRGDLGALGALFDRWSPAVYTMVERALPTTAAPGDVDRVVEEVFWLAWRRASADAPASDTLRQWMGTLISDCVQPYRQVRSPGAR